MRTADAESLARWAESLRSTIHQADAELARPLGSPGLRCACAAVQMVRLCRVARGSLVVATTGLSLAHDTARAGSLQEALRLGRVAGSAAYLASRASWSALRAGGRVGSAGWSAWPASLPTPRPPFGQLVHRTISLCRATLLVIGDRTHDRL